MNELTEKQTLRLERDLKIIVDRLIAELPQLPEAIFLCGGYGRGEGAWLVDNEGNVAPYNDYDLAVITEVPLPSKKNNELRRSLAKDIGINWVDIDYYTKKDLKSLKSTIHNVDLLYGSRCVYGNRQVLDICPKLDSTQIGFFDVLMLYRIRIWTFLGSWNGDFHDLKSEEAIFFKNQMAKATLAACDLFLIKNHSYTSSYVKRSQLVCDLYKDDALLCNRVKWAINEKLHPSIGPMDRIEMYNLYFEVKKIFLKALSIAFGRDWRFFKKPETIKKWYIFHTKYILIDMYERVFKRTETTSKMLDVFVAQVSVFLANNEGKIQSDYLKLASRILIKWGYLSKEETDWSVLHSVVADARNNI